MKNPPVFCSNGITYSVALPIMEVNLISYDAPISLITFRNIHLFTLVFVYARLNSNGSNSYFFWASFVFVDDPLLL